MKRSGLSLLLGVLLGLGSPAMGQPESHAPADPAAVAGAELAFARMAADEGQWTAFAAWSTSQALMFVPQPVNAHEFLRGLDNPPRSVTWQPQEVWSSCDGSLAFTRGPWQRADGTVGYFTTLWQRQDDGSYKWLLDQGDVLPEPLPEMAVVEARVAECPASNLAVGEPFSRASTDAGERFSFRSADGSLYLTLTVATDLGRSWQLQLLSGGDMVTVTEGHVAGPEG